MKYRELQIKTQRDSPNNARTEGFAFLVRAGYLTRENTPTQLGRYALEHLRGLPDIVTDSLSTIGNDKEIFFPIAAGDVEIAHCPHCKYTERLELARFAKFVGASHTPSGHFDSPLPLEKIATPDCNTIESLANFLNIPKEKTAKALMYTRVSDSKFVFVVVRGDMQLSEAKLKAKVGDVHAATAEEIIGTGAVPGYASAIGLALTTEGSVEGLREALLVADDLIPQSPNLVSGANETGFHLKNTNYGRDYSAEIVADLIQAKAGDVCATCHNPLVVMPAISLKNHNECDFNYILLALAETHHDDKGLTFPHPIAPFDVYLMQVPGKEIDTRAKAEGIYTELQGAGISVLFDDRDERAGVKFNDADLIGAPVRVTVGEKGLKEGMVELKPRKERENQLVETETIVEKIKNLLK